MTEQAATAPPPQHTRPVETEESLFLREAVDYLRSAAQRDTGQLTRTALDSGSEHDKKIVARAETILGRAKSKDLPVIWTEYDSHTLDDGLSRQPSDLLYFEGAVIQILEQCGEWALGSYRGKAGLFPWNHANEGPFVRTIADNSEESDGSLAFAMGDLIPVRLTTSPEWLFGYHDLHEGFLPTNCVTPVGDGLSHVDQRLFTVNRFSHDSLGNNQIRIIRVTREHAQRYARCGRSSIFVALDHVDVDDVPSYTALSYCWGDPDRTETIFCNDKLLDVPRNLAAALRWCIPDRYAKPDSDYDNWSDLYLWADAICINQANALEKNHQVPFMKEIYGRAENVNLYVNESYKSIPLLISIGLIFNLKRQSKEWVVADHASASKRLEKVNWESISEFVAQPCFRRSWIMQELVLSKNENVWYGQAQLHLGGIHGMIEIIQSQALRPPNSRLGLTFANDLQKRSYNQGVRQIYNIAVIKSFRDQGKSKNFVEVLSRFRATEAGDLRDKIYSVLSLADEGYRQALTPEYSPENTAAAVYKQLARHAATRPEITDLLLAAGLSQRLQGLPSWTPDWSIEARESLDPKYYRCAGDTTVEARLSGPDEEQLILKGTLVDAVAIVNLPWQSEFDFSKNGKSPAMPVAPRDVGEHAFGIMINDALSISISRVAKAIGWTDATIAKISWAVWDVLVCGRGWGERRYRPEDKRHYDAYIAFYGGHTQRDTMDKYIAPEILPDSEREKYVDELFPFFNTMIRHQEGRRTCITKQFRLATVPEETQQDDVIAIFSGFSVPFVLRRVVGFDVDAPKYVLVGHCYVQGIMDGELVVKDEISEAPIPTGSTDLRTAENHNHEKADELLNADQKTMSRPSGDSNIKSTPSEQAEPLLSEIATLNLDDTPTSTAAPKNELRVHGTVTVDITLV